tara:strand:- start:6432 stop:8102 length:1671 start_codon:yes stop_codon:yes gene_type:complete
MSRRTSITGEGIKDETIESEDIASGSIKAGELSAQSISGQSTITTTDTTNDRLLIWDATDSALKQVSIGNLGVAASPAGSDTQVQYNDGGSTGGAAKLLYDDSNGRLKIGDTNAPQNVLDVYGNVSNDFVAVIDNDASSGAHGLKVTSDGTGTGTNIFDVESSSTVVFRVRGDGRVGIGKISSLPAARLTVSGSSGDADIAVAEKIQHIGDSDTYIEFQDDELHLAAGGRTFIKLEEASNDKLIVNHGGLDIDLQVKGENSANLIRTDAANDLVGINTKDPTALLHVSSSDDGVIFKAETSYSVAALLVSGSGHIGINTSVTPEILTINGVESNSDETLIQFTEDGSNRAKIGVNTSNNILIENQYTNKHIVLKVNDNGVTREAIRCNGAVAEVVVNEGHSALVDFRVESDDNTHMLFVDGSSNTIGINDSTPTSTLSIMGSLAFKVLNINAANDPGTTYTISDSDCVILVNTRPTAQGGIDSAITLTLPDAASNPGMVITVKDSGGYSDVNNITISRAGSDTIEGVATTIPLNNVAAFTTLISNGSSDWSEIGKG